MSEHQILVVDDDKDMREALSMTLSDSGYDCLSAGSAAEALQVLDSNDVSLLLTDMQMDGPSGADLMRMTRERRPQMPVILMSAYGTIDEAVSAVLDGAANYLVKPFDIGELSRRIDQMLPSSKTDPIAVDPGMVAVVETARMVADSDVTVTISGESGTGKEVIAREVHRNSTRRNLPMVAINCAAIPAQMLEAILFGHIKGAFTGASEDTPGKFEQAQGSTLLLDEVSEMDLALQAKLLRVLQEREVERLGSSKSIALDVRVIATTNRNLEQAVQNGEFREDLYYRLNVFPVTVPALRDRRSDIVPLAKHFLSKHASSYVPAKLSEQAANRLAAHAWPGNVRELENQMQRALVLSAGGEIEEKHLSLSGHAMTVGETVAPAEDDLHSAMLDQESRTILAALRATNGGKAAAADKLGISARTLRYKIAKLRKSGIDIDSKRNFNPSQGVYS